VNGSGYCFDLALQVLRASVGGIAETLPSGKDVTYVTEADGDIRRPTGSRRDVDGGLARITGQQFIGRSEQGQGEENQLAQVKLAGTGFDG
jgi:hypothetical protein